MSPSTMRPNVLRIPPKWVTLLQWALIETVYATGLTQLTINPQIASVVVTYQALVN